MKGADFINGEQIESFAAFDKHALSADYWLAHAAKVIFSTYGDKVSIDQKNKDLLKFGHNEAVGTSETTIQHQPAGILHETYVASNLITSIISTNNGDTQSVVVEGHTVDGSGNFTFVTQTVTLTGQTVVTLGTALARVTRLYNDDTADFAGTISVTEDDTYTAGVPDTAAKVHLETEAGENQSEKGSTTISSTDYWILTSMWADCLEKSAAFAEVILQIRLKGKTFRHQARSSVSAQSGTSVINFKPYLIVPANSDVRLIAVASGANTSVSGGMQGILAKVV